MNGVGEATEYMECSFALPSFLSVGSPFHSMSSPNELEKNCCEAFETKDGMFSFSVGFNCLMDSYQARCWLITNKKFGGRNKL